MTLCFIDTETTGLVPAQDTIIELALIKGDEERVYWFQLSPQELGSASPQALKVNNYYDRSGPLDPNHGYGDISRRRDFDFHHVLMDERSGYARHIARFTADCVLAGNTVKFDQQFLEAWLRRNGACPVWDYHVVDVPTFAAGVMVGRLSTMDNPRQDLWEKLSPPFKSSNISEAMLCPQPGEENMGDKHTALADARWSKRMWEMSASRNFAPLLPAADDAGAAAERAAPAVEA